MFSIPAYLPFYFVSFRVFTALFQTLIHPLNKVRRGVPSALCHRVTFAPDRRKVHICAVILKHKRQIYLRRERRITLGNSRADPSVTGNCGLLISIIICREIIQRIIHISALSHGLSFGIRLFHRLGECRSVSLIII